VDEDYVVSWGRREVRATLALAAVLVAALSILSWAHSAYWGLSGLLICPCALLLIFFFRNPSRTVPSDPGILVSPADGTVRDIERAAEGEFVGAPCVRIGIFLSIFDVHLNRAPSSGRVEWLCHRQGSHLDARHAAAGRENESNAIGICREDDGGPPGVRILVRQISGAIARRIVCPLKPSAFVARGGLLGMIKYGSRTELYIPEASGARVCVKVGDKVKAGTTVVASWPADAAADTAASGEG
jgi:phosphatidylserine decarboxylase